MVSHSKEESLVTLITHLYRKCDKKKKKRIKTLDRDRWGCEIIGF